MANEPLDIGEDKSLLLVDDDEPFLKRLAKAMEKRGFSVEQAGSVAAGRAIATARPPAFAVVDLRLEDGNGLDVVEVLRAKRPDCRVVVLTGYGAIATAVAAGVFSGAEAEGFTASGGDDYELLFTLPPAALASLQAELARGEITVIGALASGAGLWLMAQGVLCAMVQPLCRIT